MKSNRGSSGDCNHVQLIDLLRWAEPPAPGIVVAASSDDGKMSENLMLAHLSAGEQAKAQALTVPAERRHFIFRRCFQRLFLAEVTQWHGKLSDLRLEHNLDQPPKALDAPFLQLSFSSSGTTVLGCAASRQQVGIDVEAARQIERVDKLSQRFFTAAEAEFIAQLPETEKNLAFLHYWTIKEAGLKATGKGIVSGLNSFEVSVNAHGYCVENVDESGQKRTWTVQHLEFLPGHVVALVHRSAV